MEVLLHFEQESNGQLNIFGRKGEEAVLSVLGREFGITEGSGGGGATTLAGMGVGGNVLIRLGFRKIEVSAASTNSSIAAGPSNSNVQSPVQPISPPSASPPRSAPPTSPPAQSQTQMVSPKEIPLHLPEVTPDSLPEESSLPSQRTPTPPIELPGPTNRNRVVYTAASASTPAAAKRSLPLFKLTIVDLDDSVYNMTTEQAKGYQAHLAANAKAYNERTFMTREMREAADLEKANKRVFTKVFLLRCMC
jgi:hypothetical protein